MDGQGTSTATTVAAGAGGWEPADAPRLPLALAATPAHSFVGRDEALEALTAAWNASERGPGRIVLVGGEAGAGKTRLVTELARVLHGGGACVLYGSCDDDLALPYQPWVQGTQQLLAALPGAAMSSELASQLAPLAQLLPHIRWLTTGATRRSPDPEAERFRTYNAFATMLETAADRWRTLLVLDDLHWAGPQTLALLRHMARTGLPTGVLVVGTFRDTGDQISPAFADWLAEMRRVDGLARLRLGGLDLAAVECLVADAAGRELDAELRDLAALLAGRTGGNAFYVVELWRDLTNAESESARSPRTRRVPDSVREVVTARLTRLSPTARTTLDMAALSGQRVEMDVVAAATDLDPSDLDAAVAELIAGGLLAAIPDAAEAHRFEHAIVRDTVEAAIAPHSRTRMHTALGVALERAYEADRRPVLAELARHFAAAAPLVTADKAIYYGRRAAAQATRSAAYDEAIAQLDAVLNVAPDSVERAEILVDLGNAHLRRGSFVASRDAFSGAFEIARRLGAPDLAGQAAVGFETATHFPGLPGGPAYERLRQAMEMIGDAASPSRARVLASMGRALAFAGRREDGLETAIAAVVLARSIDDPESLIVALEALSTSVDDPPRVLAASEELAEVADRLGDPWGMSYASGNRIRALIALGRLDDARDTLERHRAISSSSRFATFSFMTHAYDVALLLAAGDLSGAEAAAERAQAMGAADDAPFDAGVYGLQMYAVRRAQGRLTEVAPVMRVLAASADPPPMWRPGLAALYSELEMLDEAREVFDQLSPSRFTAVARDAVWPACLTFLAETCIALGDREQAFVLFEELLAFRGLNLMAGMTICFGPADRLLGGLAELVDRPVDADEHFRVALALAEASGSPLWLAEVRYDWARVLAARGALDDARRLAERAIADASLLGIRRLSGRSVPGSRPAAPVSASPRVPVEPRPGGMTAREAEVLRLVAEGCSNRGIGERLFISQNTVANHVRSILRKTGCVNRADAASFAVRHGLAR